jgi:hypothetical protein
VSQNPCIKRGLGVESLPGILASHHDMILASRASQKESRLQHHHNETSTDDF